MVTTRTSDQGRCPACQSKLDAATGLQDDQKPKQGDFSVCMYCSVWLVFNNDLTLRLMAQAEIETMDPLEKQHLQTATEMARRVRKIAGR